MKKEVKAASPRLNFEGIRINFETLMVADRPLTPFALAAAVASSPALAGLAAMLDRGLSTHVGGIKVSGDFILFTLGSQAFAATTGPLGIYMGMAHVSATYFPLHTYHTLADEDQLMRWLRPHVLIDDDDVGELRPYQGPRLFGDNILLDNVLPVILQGCQLL